MSRVATLHQGLSQRKIHQDSTRAPTKGPSGHMLRMARPSLPTSLILDAAQRVLGPEDCSRERVSAHSPESIHEHIIETAVVPAQSELESLDNKREPDSQSKHSAPSIEHATPSARQEPKGDEEEEVSNCAKDARHEAGSVGILLPEATERQKVDSRPAEAARWRQGDEQDPEN
jgi:hypothetical protein